MRDRDREELKFKELFLDECFLKQANTHTHTHTHTNTALRYLKSRHLHMHAPVSKTGVPE